MQFYAMYSAVFSGVLAPLSRTIFAPTFSANWMLASSERRFASASSVEMRDPLWMSLSKICTIKFVTTSINWQTAE